MNAVTHPFRKRAEMPSVWALRGVSFTVNESELVGIVGRNGAGKTTLLEVLANITYPTAGELTVHGRVASLVEVGTGFHNELTGRENVFLNGSILGLRKKEIEENFDAIVDFAGVEKFIDTPIKRYSTGMRLRLGFAVAAHLSSDILLVDEVLAVGDMEFQRRCLTTLGRVRDNGRTVLFVSHNLEAIERLCPRTISIDEGRIRADGETRDVIASYLATVSEAETNRVDLANETKRSGTGEVRYTRVEYLDRNKVPLSVIRSGFSASSRRRKSFTVSKAIAIWALSFTRLEANRNLLTAMSLLPKSIHRCRRYPTKFNSGRDIPSSSHLTPNDVPGADTARSGDGADPDVRSERLRGNPG